MPLRRRPPSKPTDRAFARYLVRRVAYALLVIVVVAVTVFVVTRVATDPARQMLPLNATEEQYQRLSSSLGLDKPVPEQFWTYLKGVVTLDLGESYWQKVPVTDLIADRFANTALLGLVALLIAMAVGIPIGVITALKPGSRRDQVLSAIALIGLSLPQFWLGAMLIFLFAVNLGWLPTSGTGGASHLVLPAVTLALPIIGRIAQMTRTTMIDELSSQHILAARAKGLSTRYLIARHALRNVAVPVTTVCSWEAAYVLAGESVLVETVFAWPGLGFLATQAIRREDLILLQGIVIVVALIVVTINIVTDLLYARIDPRIELR